jgi:hypothetical protein
LRAAGPACATNPLWAARIRIAAAAAQAAYPNRAARKPRMATDRRLLYRGDRLPLPSPPLRDSGIRRLFLASLSAASRSQIMGTGSQIMGTRSRYPRPAACMDFPVSGKPAKADACFIQAFDTEAYL